VEAFYKRRFLWAEVLVGEDFNGWSLFCAEALMSGGLNVRSFNGRRL
jgi:hypothetical protein